MKKKKKHERRMNLIFYYLLCFRCLPRNFILFLFFFVWVFYYTLVFQPLSLSLSLPQKKDRYMAIAFINFFGFMFDCSSFVLILMLKPIWRESTMPVVDTVEVFFQNEKNKQRNIENSFIFIFLMKTIFVVVVFVFGYVVWSRGGK